MAASSSVVTSGTRRAILFAVLLLWCGALIALRSVRWQSPELQSLIWNLFLAVVPAVAAALFARSEYRRSPIVVRITWFAVWLLFLPNAPYIATDFVHLFPRPPVPLWFDIALLLSCAATGLLLGFSSVAEVQAVITRSRGRTAGWALATFALLMSGFGIYLGRFLRWNSWDALVRPKELARYVAPRASHPLSHPRSFAVTLIYGVGLVLGYVALRVFSSTFARRDPERRSEHAEIRR
jgi:uncharacterized membrane protein